MSEEDLKSQVQKDIEFDIDHYYKRANSQRSIGSFLVISIAACGAISSVSQALVFFGVLEANTGLVGSLISALGVIFTAAFTKLNFTANANAARRTCTKLQMVLIESKSPEKKIADSIKEYAAAIGEHEVIEKKPD